MSSPATATATARPHSLLSPLGQGLWLLLVAALVLAPSADWAWGIDPTPPPQENRRLAPEPGQPSSLDEWIAWPAKVEAWFKDGFGLRNSLIAWHSTLMLDYLGVSPNKDVLIGKQGWLYFGISKNVDSYRCLAPFTPAELKVQVAEAKRRQQWLAKRNIRYGHVWVPIKANIYPEFLPDGLTKLDQPCRLQQWIAAVGKAGIPVLDLTEALKAAKAADPFEIYYRTDTHWNPRGAWHGYQAMAPWLKKLVPTLPILTADQVHFDMRSDRGGDLARMLDLQERYRGIDPFLELRPTRANLVPNTAAAAKGVNLRTYECGTCGPLRGVMLHDSFGNHLRPFLAESFAHLVTAEFAGFDEKLLEAERPDFVLEVHLERQLTPER